MFRNVLLFVLLFGLAAAKGKKSHHTVHPKHNGTKHAVQDIDINSESGQTALSSLANEFVLALHDGVYIINEAIQNTQENPEFKTALIQISNDITDLAFAIQKEIHGDARQLEFQIKSGIIFLTVLLPEVTALAEKHENTTYASRLLSEATDSVLYAVQKLEVRTDLNSKTNDELATLTRSAFAQLFTLINGTKSDDTDIAEELQIQVHHLNHILDKTVNKLEVWLHANTVENENSKVVEDVAQNLGALTAELRKSISSTLTIPQLVEVMQSTFQNAAEQIAKLKQLDANANQANQEHAKDLYRDIVYDANAIAQTYIIKLTLLAKINKTES